MTIKRWITILYFSFAITIVFCQRGSPAIGRVKNPSFDKTIASMLDFSVPVLSVQEAKSKSGVTYLDARETQEYEVSRIPGALYIGAKEFDPKAVEALSKDQALVVYCSVGYRSEKIGTKLKALGFTNVYNLYGSIFEWANVGYPLVDAHNQPTKNLHTYNKKWSQWVDNKEIVKVW